MAYASDSMSCRATYTLCSSARILGGLGFIWCSWEDERLVGVVTSGGANIQRGGTIARAGLYWNFEYLSSIRPVAIAEVDHRQMVKKKKARFGKFPFFG
ncbi:Hypothetical predicted protein [Olea europaea subsp. europaea]|uniref:Uncharacterized protein n=1 Tax=Olea europaea subsp. europaea TaxID=158383 RepID=A0A8S0QXI5_OLEEU|nr:Hypothetical predicted protein [Olea europaea subsp. europaea]